MSGPSRARRELGKQLAQMRQDPLLFLWGLYVLLDPVYIFRSGLPQPGDLLIIILAPLTLARWNGRFSPYSARAVRSLFLFVAYVIASALIWSLVSGEWSLNAKQGFLMIPAYYIFDALVFMVVLVLYERYTERFVQMTVWLVLVSVCFQFAMTFIYSRGGELRSAGLFNNSNQLGYFAILTSSILMLGSRRVRLPTIPLVVAQLFCCYLALLSASRAALAAAAILMVIAVVNQLRVMIVLAFVGAFFIFIANPFESAMERSQTRVRTDQSLGFAEERGYDRILEHPEHLILGAGEGGYDRYRDTGPIGAHELHSSAGTIVFCYGIFGTTLFALFLRQVVRGATKRRFLLLMPAAAYSMTHQGLRFTLLWVFLALIVMLNDLDHRERKRNGALS